MAEIVLAYTSSGVESVAVIDQDGLDALATWLCREKDFHFEASQHKCTGADCYSCKAFDKQVEKQSYCNRCRDFAGELLSHFDLVRKVSA